MALPDGPLARLDQFSNQSGASALSHLSSKFLHGRLGDDAALAAGKSKREHRRGTLEAQGAGVRDLPATQVGKLHFHLLRLLLSSYAKARENRLSLTQSVASHTARTSP